jgi:signal peptidase II
MTTPHRSVRAAVLVAVAVVVVDQLSKWWATVALADGPIDVLWTLRFQLTSNTGMAFSQGQGFGPLIGVAALAIVVGLMVSLARGVGDLNWFGVGLIAGGAIGNVIDRVARGERWFRGGVIDFIDFQWFPVFNIADASINIGVVVIIWTALRRRDGAGSASGAATSGEEVPVADERTDPPSTGR